MTMFKTIKFKFQKKYFAFFTIVPLLLITALIRVPCPVCDGTGSISGTGMDQVSIVKTDSSLISVGQVEGCLNYRIYRYNVVLDMLNGGAINANGYVKVALYDTVTSKVMSTQYYSVLVLANTSSTNAFQAVFTVALDSPTTTAVRAEVVKSAVKCKTCSGTGKIAINYLPLAQALKKSILENQQIATSPYFAVPVQEANMPEIDIGLDSNTNTSP
jgi:hypothetical protein